MLDIQLLRSDPERVRAGMKAKGYADTSTVDRILALDEERRSLLTELQKQQHRANTAAASIGELMQSGKKEEAQAFIKESSELKRKIKGGEEEQREIDASLEDLLIELPNVAHPSVPVGSSPEQNEVLRTEAEPPNFDFDPLPHWQLAERHGLIDFDRGAKVAGAGFPFYRGKGARLQRALIQFFLDLAVDEGAYEELQPPLFINPDSARGTGQLPDKEDLMYEIGRDGLYPIPTAEVPVTNFFRDEILGLDDLPLKFCASTPCFRREAGSYGKEVRGLNRLHQFDKVELVHFAEPETSYDALEELREDAERALRRLELPYRVLLMCTGDMGFTQAKKYDLEVWSAGQKRWLEVSSISSFEDYQARRMNIRYRPAPEEKPLLVHTLNGSGLALPRVVAALLENNQEEDGTIVLPPALHNYAGFEKIG